jgi:hypothetical protein
MFEDTDKLVEEFFGAVFPNEKRGGQDQKV